MPDSINDTLNAGVRLAALLHAFIESRDALGSATYSCAEVLVAGLILAEIAADCGAGHGAARRQAILLETLNALFENERAKKTLLDHMHKMSEEAQAGVKRMDQLAKVLGMDAVLKGEHKKGTH